MDDTTPENTITQDGIINGFRISQDTLDHLDIVKRAVATELIRQGRWVLLPAGVCNRG